MKKLIRVERVYKLAEYQTIRLEEQILEIPDKLVLNTELTKKIYDLAFINLEINYRRYLKLLEELYSYTDDAVLPRLEEMKENTLEDLAKLIKIK